MLIACIIFYTTQSMSAAERNIQTVSLITCGPGPEIYELEGHTAIRLVFDDGTDLSVNWGTFDFNSPNFLYRFVKGETDYRMAVYPFAYFYDQYRHEGRRVTERVLNLTQPEKERLVELIDSTLTIGTPVYRYNYVLDNCATRPIKYIEMATGLYFEPGPETGVDKNSETFRSDMTFYHTNYPWYQFGIDLALGAGIDRHITHTEHMFAPIALEKMLDNATLQNGSSAPRQLAAATNMILPQAHGAPYGPTAFWLHPLFICWLFFALTLGICMYDIVTRKLTRWFHTFYFSIATLAGLLLTFLIFVSVHESTSPNWLYLWLNPLCLIGAVLIWLKKFKNIVYWWQIANFVALLALCAIAVARVQVLNPAFYPLIFADASLSTTWIILYKWQR